MRHGCEKNLHRGRRRQHPRGDPRLSGKRRLRGRRLSGRGVAARPVRAGAGRPCDPRRDDARAGRLRGLRAHPRDEHRADHHADRAGLRPRLRAGHQPRQRRLLHQAVFTHRARDAREGDFPAHRVRARAAGRRGGGAAPRPRARRPRGKARARGRKAARSDAQRVRGVMLPDGPAGAGRLARRAAARGLGLRDRDRDARDGRHLRRLRKKLGGTGLSVEAVWGFGFRLREEGAE